MKIETITGAEYWASYLINGDASGIEAWEQRQCDIWLKQNCIKNVLDVARDSEGEGIEPRFTWHYKLYIPHSEFSGGSVIDYVCEVE